MDMGLEASAKYGRCGKKLTKEYVEADFLREKVNAPRAQRGGKKSREPTPGRAQRGGKRNPKEPPVKPDLWSVGNADGQDIKSATAPRWSATWLNFVAGVKPGGKKSC